MSLCISVRIGVRISVRIGVRIGVRMDFHISDAFCHLLLHAFFFFFFFFNEAVTMGAEGQALLLSQMVEARLEELAEADGKEEAVQREVQ